MDFLIFFPVFFFIFYSHHSFVKKGLVFNFNFFFVLINYLTIIFSMASYFFFSSVCFPPQHFPWTPVENALCGYKCSALSFLHVLTEPQRKSNWAHHRNFTKSQGGLQSFSVCVDMRPNKLWFPSRMRRNFLNLVPIPPLSRESGRALASKNHVLLFSSWFSFLLNFYYRSLIVFFFFCFFFKTHNMCFSLGKLKKKSELAICLCLKF